MTDTTPEGQEQPAPLTRARAVLFVEDNTYAIVNPESPPDRFTDPVETGVLAVTDAGGAAASVTCGTHIGDVQVTGETWPAAPPLVDAPWDDVAEVSLPWPGGRMALWGSFDEDADEIVLSEDAPPGSYRIRVHVRGRDAGEDRGEGDEPEEHLLQIWPSAPAPHRTLKTTDHTGQYWRSQ
ncbi:hypothetical protein ABTZ93_41265 [Streptomyces sp. NPDC097941]|uniref:hypothetical protein n=1 Tax=Streptomyces sp. NPDC097941 TaxID=3155685 RepID=UPI00333317F1